jgi:hypothetical protein
VDAQTNEHKAALELLGIVLVHGTVVTGDAMFTHRDVCATLIARGGDYVLPVKENQPQLRADIMAAFAEPEAGLSPLQSAHRAARIDRACEVEKGHGRIEKRTLETTDWLAEYLQPDWPECHQVFRLQRERRFAEKVEVEVVYGIASLPRERAGAHALLSVTRGHWGSKTVSTGCVTARSGRTPAGFEKGRDPR